VKFRTLPRRNVATRTIVISGVIVALSACGATTYDDSRVTTSAAPTTTTAIAPATGPFDPSKPASCHVRATINVPSIPLVTVLLRRSGASGMHAVWQHGCSRRYRFGASTTGGGARFLR